MLYHICIIHVPPDIVLSNRHGDRSSHLSHAVAQYLAVQRRHVAEPTEAVPHTTDGKKLA